VLKPFCSSLAVACLFVCSANATAQQPDEMVRRSDPMSCARLAADFMSVPLCQYDLGTYQVARVALAGEALASALRAAGLTDSSQEIQAQLLRDVSRFGVHNAMMAPAMAMVDLASASRSPFGKDSQRVSARAMIALEYLVPGVANRAGFSLDALAKNAGVQRADGARDFESYMSSQAGKSVGLDAFRQFTSPPGSTAFATKLSIPETAFSPGAPRNTPNDITFARSASAGTSSIPMATLFTGIAGIARRDGSKLFAGSSEREGASDQLPFRGASCIGCKFPAGAANGNSIYSSDAPATILSIGTFSGSRNESKWNSPGNGRGLLEDERAARRDMIGAQASMSEAKGNAGTTTNRSSVSCELGCAAKETVRTLGMAAADFSEGVTGVVKGDSKQVSDAVDKMYYNVADNLLNGTTRCVERNCEKTGIPSGALPDKRDGKGGDGKGGDGKGGDGKGGDGKGGDEKGGDGKGGDGKGGDGKGGDGKGGDGKGGDGKGGDGKGGDGKGGAKREIKNDGQEGGNSLSTRIGTRGKVAPETGPNPAGAPNVPPVLDECRSSPADCDCQIASSGMIGRCAPKVEHGAASRNEAREVKPFLLARMAPSATSPVLQRYGSEQGPTGTRTIIQPFSFPGQNAPAYSRLPSLPMGSRP
jgi:hypothetical protein